ncbi:MAG: hypothetical protein M0024_12595 [Nitrospiraceae bacterium]|nr:hypothetical protein [Nitrospiraceae bacterium]
MKKQLLFVTYPNEEMDDALSYAVDLARTMNEGITVLLVKKKSFIEKFENMMAAVTFAEEGDHESARQFLAASEEGSDASVEKDLMTIRNKCREVGVNVNIHTATMETAPAVKTFLQNTNGIDMILLSPSITGKGQLSGDALKKLVRTVSRPIVTMSKQAVLQA